jgi:MYXO-CTERM domain-containing protein
MLSLLLLTSTAFPCAALLTNDEGAIASSDAQEVILETTETGVRTSYRVRYDGDAESFGWLIVVHGGVGEGDVQETDEDVFDTLRDLTQPRQVTLSFTSGGGGVSCGCTGDMAVRGTDNFAGGDTAGAWGVDVVAEGFAGPYAYQVLAPEDGDGLSGWLEEEGFSLGETVSTIDEYIEEGGYSFVAISLAPTLGQTPDEGRTLPALAIDSDSDQLHFPARMAQTGMAEEIRTTIWVIGDASTEITSGWDSQDSHRLGNGEDEDSEGVYDAALQDAAVYETPTYLSPFSGEYGEQWVTRFDTLAPREVHTADPIFESMGEAYSWQLEIIVPSDEDEDEARSAAWLLLPLLGLGWTRRRRRI